MSTLILRCYPHNDVVLAQSVVGRAKKGARFTHGLTCATEHATRAALSASAFHRGRMATPNCAASAIPIGRPMETEPSALRFLRRSKLSSLLTPYVMFHF